MYKENVVIVTKWLSHRKEEDSMDELKKMGEGGQATGGGPTLFYFFFSLSERALPYITVSSQWEYLIGPWPDPKLRLSFSSSAITLRAEHAKLPSLPQITLDKSNSGFLPSNRSNNIPTICEWILLSQHLLGYSLPVQHTLNGLNLFRLRTERNYNSKLNFSLYFGVFKYEKVSVVKFHLWNMKLWDLFFL